MADIRSTIFLWIVEKTTGQVRRGKPIAVVSGALLGAALGAAFAAPVAVLPGQPNTYLLLFGGLLGSVVGAIAGGMLFPRPPRAPRVISLSDAGGEIESCGAILQSWFFQFNDSIGITVLMEHAIYSACGEGVQPAQVLDQLATGVDPEIPGADLIPLGQFEAIEFLKVDDKELLIFYRTGNRVRRRHLAFATMSDRRAFFVALQWRLGRLLEHDHVEMSLLRAVMVPGFWTLLLVALIGGAASLASYWRAFPPAPPVGKPGPDPLVQFMTWAGPEKILPTIVPALLLLLGWLVVRALYRPRVHRLTLSVDAPASMDPAVFEAADPLTDLVAVDDARAASALRSQRLDRFGNAVVVLAYGLSIGLIFTRVGMFIARQPRIGLENHQKLERDLESARQAVREGKAGEAARRLFFQERQEFLRQKQSQNAR